VKEMKDIVLDVEVRVSLCGRFHGFDEIVGCLGTNLIVIQATP
jgi:hypothetical protein